MAAVTPSDSQKHSLSLWNFFTIGFGAIIGTGWIFLVGEWLVISGGPLPAMLAFLLGALLLPVGAVFGELTSSLPLDGGMVEYVDRTYGKTASFVTGWLLLLSNIIMCPWETIAISTLFAQMFGSIFPLLRSVKLYTVLGADVYLWPTLIALGFAAFIIRQNLHGAAAAAKTQAFLTKALLTVTPFFYTGFDTIPQQAEEAAQGLDWHRFGRIISLSLLAAGGFYMICIAAFSSLMPWTAFVQEPLAALACLRQLNFTLYFVMLCITVLGALGPMNSFYASSARLVTAMARKQQLPLIFTPPPGKPAAASTHALLIFCTVLAPFLGGNMLLPLTNVAALTFMFACTMVCLACYRLRRSEPALHRPYKVPGGRFGIGCACAIGSCIVALMLLPGSAASLNPAEYLLLSAWIVLGALVKALHRYGHRA